MKTPMQEHYELLVWWRDETIKKSHAVPENIEYYDGMIWAFEFLMNSIEVKGLEKEKEFMQKIYANAKATGEMNEAVKTFNTKEK